MTWFPSLRSHDRRRRHAAIGVLLVALVAVGTAAAVTTRATVAPSNVALPTTGGTNTVGSTLTANPGTWNGSTPLTFQYVWPICDDNGAACHDITGATSQTYLLKVDDAGNTVRVRVTATNTDGSASALSAPSARIAAGRRRAGQHRAAVDHRHDGDRKHADCQPRARGRAPRRSRSPTSGRSVTRTARRATTSPARPPTRTSSRAATPATRCASASQPRTTAGTTNATSAASARIGVQKPGCPTPPAGTTTVSVDNVTSPARLQVNRFQITSGQLTLSTAPSPPSSR